MKGEHDLDNGGNTREISGTAQLEQVSTNSLVPHIPRFPIAVTSRISAKLVGLAPAVRLTNAGHCFRSSEEDVIDDEFAILTAPRPRDR